ncbi:SMP-30/gluconolactonase/LRE family protein [Flavobacterium soyangense]|uniref:SMP-30/gluconolactonase/LRE family protein n=1 Tax=Flavobacterium soyangense TaxID=2023265 RepID=A0A930U9S5_9FLAO|nr:SMP-30/gluconolactonase/LRE family protein [Flavobacterium soyangense]MBF2709558.1 SMP-30/gluconolactonase/LRE family protein [Flavobacterium soyangense]
MRKIKSIILVISGAILILSHQSCALKPLAWNPPINPLFEGITKLNNELTTVEKIDLGGWVGAEDIVFDSIGNLYCGVHKAENDFSDGKILKINPDGKVEIFYDAGSWVAGLHFDKQNNLIALSHKLGLISISPLKKVVVLANKDDRDRRFLIPNGLDIDSKQNMYFTNTSSESPYTIKYGRKLILEMRPNGGLYQYNPSTKVITTLIDGTYFGNGVVISKDETFLLMVETTKYQILKYWLKGSNAGKTEIFMDNLPGFPNGISIREDGTFWLGFTTKRNDALDKIHPKKGMKKFVYGLPNWLQPKQDKFGMVMHLSENGKILNSFFDPTGIKMSEAGSVKEQNGYLYMGGDNLPYIGKYKLEP